MLRIVAFVLLFIAMALGFATVFLEWPKEVGWVACGLLLTSSAVYVVYRL